MRRHELTDDQWDQIEDFFPPNGNRGNQWKNYRLMVNGIIWILATGSAWRDLPKRFGPWKSVYERFRMCSPNGFLDKMASKFQSNLQSKGRIDWSLFNIEGTSVRGHKSVAGAKKKLFFRGAKGSRFRLQSWRIRYQNSSCL